MTEENSWKSREDDDDDEPDETVRTTNTYPYPTEAHYIGLQSGQRCNSICH